MLGCCRLCVAQDVREHIHTPVRKKKPFMSRHVGNRDVSNSMFESILLDPEQENILFSVLCIK